MRGGKPYGIEVTGYYDNDGNLMDFKIDNKVDPDKYFEKHKISLEPPGTIMEQLVDLFRYDPDYVKKAEKRIGYVLDAPEVEIIDGKKIYTTPSNRLDKRTKYIVVNTEDDIKRININNELIKKLAEIAKDNNKKKGGAENENKVATNVINQATDKAIKNITKYDEFVKQLNVEEIFKDSEDKQKIATEIIQSPGFMRLVKTYFPDQFSDNEMPLDKQHVTPSTEQNNQEKINKLVEIVENLSKKLDTLVDKLENKPIVNKPIESTATIDSVANKVNNNTSKDYIADAKTNQLTATDVKNKISNMASNISNAFKRTGPPRQNTRKKVFSNMASNIANLVKNDNPIAVNKLNESFKIPGGKKSIKPKQKRVRKTRRLR